MKNILMIPYWIHEQLNRNKLRVEELLDYSKINRVLSAVDKASLLRVYTELDRLIGKRPESDVDPLPENSLYHLWERTAGDHAEDFRRATNLSYDLSVSQDLTDRLFSQDSYDPRYPEPFNTYDLASTVVGVVVYPGHFVEGVPHQDKSILVLESILRVFYAYDSHHEVARHPCFKQYLRLLQPRSVIV